MNGFASNPAVAWLLRRFGVDALQYSLLLNLFSKLSDRQEFGFGGSYFSLRIGVGLVAVIRTRHDRPIRGAPPLGSGVEVEVTIGCGGPA